MYVCMYVCEEPKNRKISRPLLAGTNLIKIRWAPQKLYLRRENLIIIIMIQKIITVTGVTMIIMKILIIIIMIIIIIIIITMITIICKS